MEELGVQFAAQSCRFLNNALLNVFFFFHFNDCRHSNKLSVSCTPRYADLLQQDFEEPAVRLVISIQ